MCISFRTKEGTTSADPNIRPVQAPSETSSFLRKKYTPPRHIRKEQERIDRQNAMRDYQRRYATTDRGSRRRSGGGWGDSSTGDVPYYAVYPGDVGGGWGGSHHHGGYHHGGYHHGGHDSGGGHYSGGHDSGGHDSGGWGGGCDSGGGGDSGGGDGGGGGD